MNDDRPPDPDVESVLELSGRDVPATGPSLDAVHRLLASARRRAVLSYLSASDGAAVDVEELVSVVAEGERPAPGPGAHRDRVAADLHHVHLPKLADADVIDFDPVDGTVRYERTAAIEAFLALGDAMQERDG